MQSKPFRCLRFAIFCKLKVIVESLEGLWQWQGSRSYRLEISKSGSLGSGRFLTTDCSRFFSQNGAERWLLSAQVEEGESGSQTTNLESSECRGIWFGLTAKAGHQQRQEEEAEVWESEKTRVEGAGSDEEKVGRRRLLRHESVTNGIPYESVSLLIGQKGRTNRRTRSTASSSRLSKKSIYLFWWPQ